MIESGGNDSTYAKSSGRDPALRNEGYTLPGLKCVTGNLPPMLGYAATCKVKSENPPSVVAAEMEFPMFAGSVSVSHSYTHLVGFGEPVEILGLKIQSGDLLYGDCHGVISIPIPIAAEIPGVAAAIVGKKRTIVDLCRSPGFSVDELRKLVHRL